MILQQTDWQQVAPFLSRSDGAVPGATTAEERAFCEFYGQSLYGGLGKIVELGPWLGSLTQRYCRGLRNNPLPETQKTGAAEIYDLFHWDPYMEDWAEGSPHAGKVTPGSNFQGYFEGLHEGDANYFSAHTVDLAAFEWTGAPVEFLLNDAAKTPAIGACILEQLAPCLLPGCSLVAHQDFLWCTDAYIQVYQFLLRNHFTLYLEVPNSAMTIFRTVETPPPSAVANLPRSFREIPADLVRECFAWSRETLRQTERRYLDLAEACTLEQCGDLEGAHRLVQDLKLAEPAGDLLYDFMVEAVKGWDWIRVISD